MRVKAALLCLGFCLTILGCQSSFAPNAALRPESASLATILPDLKGGPEGEVRKHTTPPPIPPDVYLRGDPHLRLAALTFDDGPDARFTPMVLDALRAEAVKATFFIVGERALHRPDLVRRIVAEGHEIGNHSMTHPLLTRVSPLHLRAELQVTDHLLRYITGHSPTIFRPPYGAFSPHILHEAKGLGYRTVLWDVDSGDWRPQTSTREVLFHVFSEVKPGAIVLQHAGGGVGEDLTDTVLALPQMIRSLRASGYQLVTVSELLGTGEVRPGVW